MKLTLKALRINKGYSQEEAAEKLGIYPTTLGNYENFRSFPDVPIINKIINLYDTNYDDIIFLPQNCNLIAKNKEKKRK